MTIYRYLISQTNLNFKTVWRWERNNYYIQNKKRKFLKIRAAFSEYILKNTIEINILLNS